VELLLLSNSTNYGEPMFAHASEEFRELCAGDVVTFIPFALADWDDYADRVTDALGRFDIEVRSAHRDPAPDRAIMEADVVLMGGGNTFRLLDSLAGLDIVRDLAQRVRTGDTRYAGSSAGTNVTCPTIRTTNDMPICQPRSFEALGLLPFQVNLHYVDTDPTTTYMGETRDERIHEFLEENDCPVLAMYEGSLLRVRGDEATMRGPARLFRRGGVDDLADGDDVTPLLRATPAYDGGARPRRGNRPSRGVG